MNPAAGDTDFDMLKMIIGAAGVTNDEATKQVETLVQGIKKIESVVPDVGSLLHSLLQRYLQMLYNNVRKDCRLVDMRLTSVQEDVKHLIKVVEGDGEDNHGVIAHKILGVIGEVFLPQLEKNISTELDLKLDAKVSEIKDIIKDVPGFSRLKSSVAVPAGDKIEIRRIAESAIARADDVAADLSQLREDTLEIEEKFTKEMEAEMVHCSVILKKEFEHHTDKMKLLEEKNNEILMKRFETLERENGMLRENMKNLEASNAQLLETYMQNINVQAKMFEIQTRMIEKINSQVEPKVSCVGSKRSRERPRKNPREWAKDEGLKRPVGRPRKMVKVSTSLTNGRPRGRPAGSKVVNGKVIYAPHGNVVPETTKDTEQKTNDGQKIDSEQQQEKDAEQETNTGKNTDIDHEHETDAEQETDDHWESDPCAVCGVDDDNLAIICDGCDRAHHVKCLGLKTVPKGKWYCVDC